MKLLNTTATGAVNHSDETKYVHVESANCRYENGYIESDYEYNTVRCSHGEAGRIQAIPMTTKMTFRTSTSVPKLGLMLVGWGGNNGTTVTGAVLANKLGLSFMTKDGEVKANYYGSLTQASTVYVGADEHGRDVYMPLCNMLPMVDPNDLVIDGWDISSLNVAEAMRRAKVLDYDLQRQLWPHMENMKPRPAIFDSKFVAANQQARADNVLKGSKQAQIERVRRDIREFKEQHGLDKVIVLCTANTERYVDVRPELHGTSANLLAAIERGEEEISPSIMYAVASIMEGCAFINGSPQNTFVPGLIALAEERGVFIAGDDFKSGQTKFKSVVVDFLISAGIKPASIVSYNHLGNNDGYNLSSAAQFRSKEISKSGVVDDMVDSNRILYPDGRRPDHCVVIKYVPFVGDSKRAMDEYISELMLGGRNTLVVHNTCEDSLLAAPIILDLVLLMELCQRITFKVHGGTKGFVSFHPIQSILAYLCKAPLVEPRATVVNALQKQRAQIENLLRALISLPPVDHLHLENKMPRPEYWFAAKKSSTLSKTEALDDPLVNLISNTSA